MRGDQIKQRRVQMGWTQADLAKAAGCGQAMISMVERSAMKPSPVLHARIVRCLAERSTPIEKQESAASLLAPTIPPPSFPAQMPLSAREWFRPQLPGDFLVVQSLTADSVFIAVLDISGNAPAVSGQRLYLQGWLRGWLSKQTTTPQLKTVVQDLSAEMETTGIQGAGCFVLLALHGGFPHTVSYEAASCGFPPPLLLCGPPYRTPESCSLGPPLPCSSRTVESIRIDRLSAPWSLILASDGLLSRLGGGDETAGVKAVRRWQTGRSREQPPDTYLMTRELPLSDEFFARVEWTGWDEQSAFDITNDAECRRVVALCTSTVDRVLGKKTGDLYRQCLVEAINNAHRHAYGGGEGRLTVRFREEMEGFRAEVEDEGRGEVTEKQMDKPRGGFALMRKNCAGVFVRNSANRGTIVQLLLAKPAADAPTSRDHGKGEVPT